MVLTSGIIIMGGICFLIFLLIGRMSTTNEKKLLKFDIPIILKLRKLSSRKLIIICKLFSSLGSIFSIMVITFILIFYLMTSKRFDKFFLRRLVEKVVTKFKKKKRQRPINVVLPKPLDGLEPSTSSLPWMRSTD